MYATSGRRLAPTLQNLLRMYPQLSTIDAGITQRDNPHGTITITERRLTLVFKSDAEGAARRQLEAAAGPLSPDPDFTCDPAPPWEAGDKTQPASIVTDASVSRRPRRVS